MNHEGITLSIHAFAGDWISKVVILSPNGDAWQKEDKCESMDHAAGMAIVQLQAWIENKKGLPPAGVNFGKETL